MKNLSGQPENREQRLAMILTGIAAFLFILFIGISVTGQFHRPPALTAKDTEARDKWQGALKKICAVHPDRKYCRFVARDTMDTDKPGTSIQNNKNQDGFSRK